MDRKVSGVMADTSLGVSTPVNAPEKKYRDDIHEIMLNEDYAEEVPMQNISEMTPVSKPVIKQEESSSLDHIHIRGAAEEKTATESVSTVSQEEPWPEMENLNKTKAYSCGRGLRFCNYMEVFLRK